MAITDEQFKKEVIKLLKEINLELKMIDKALHVIERKP